MKLDNFENYLRENPDKEVPLYPHACGSWRGVYSEPCIFVKKGETSILKDWLPFCERLKTETFEGYKGGEYKYSGDEYLHLEENWGNYGGDDNLWEVFFTPVQKPLWKKLSTREADPEEVAQGYTFMWDGETPELGEEVLVSDGKTIWTDTWIEFDIGIGFEQTDYDSDCWWMPFPALPGKEVQND